MNGLKAYLKIVWIACWARIKAKVKQYVADPQSRANNVKALQGSTFIRLRVGDWRVIMDDQGNVLFIIEIGPRGDIYK